MKSLKSDHVTGRKINIKEQMNEKPRKWTEKNQNAKLSLEFTLSVNDVSIPIKVQIGRVDQIKNMS